VKRSVTSTQLLYARNFGVFQMQDVDSLALACAQLHGQRNVIMTEAERPHSAGARLVPDEGMVEVTTTVKTKGKGAGAIVMPTTNRALASLSLYKDIKKIQTTLRKDDITWDC
jgi:hypothetical protein